MLVSSEQRPHHLGCGVHIGVTGSDSRDIPPEVRESGEDRCQSRA